MVAHLRPGMDSPAEAPTDVTQTLEPNLAVDVLLKNLLAALPTSHHVMDPSGCLVAELASHATSFPDDHTLAPTPRPKREADHASQSEHGGRLGDRGG